MRTTNLARILLSAALGASLGACGRDAGAPGEAAKGGEAKGGEAKGGEAKAAGLHLDVQKDRSGALARAAAAIEASERVTAEGVRSRLAAASHHAEAGPSNEAICRHILAVEGHKDEGVEECAKMVAHHRVLLGPELFAEVAACTMAATTVEAMASCEAGEKEAEEALHAKSHGDGLDRATCEGFIAHFGRLVIADSGDQGEAVAKVVEEVREDLIAECVAQGTKKEVECALAATDLAGVAACEPA